MLLDVVDAKDRCAAVVRCDGGRERRRERAGARVGVAEKPPERALPREADQQGAAEREEHVEPRDELEVLLDRLAEADAWIETDPFLGDPAGDGEPQPLLEERGDIRGDVDVTW